jgi:acyl transferase domain-containing protein
MHATEATLMDPQQRMLLECAAELVLGAGCNRLSGVRATL